MQLRRQLHRAQKVLHTIVMSSRNQSNAHHRAYLFGRPHVVSKFVPIKFGARRKLPSEAVKLITRFGSFWERTGLGFPAVATAGTGEASFLGSGVSLPSDRNKVWVLVSGLPNSPLRASLVPSFRRVGSWEGAGARQVSLEAVADLRGYLHAQSHNCTTVNDCVAQKQVSNG
jgi:hypothetical protein